MHGLIKGMTFYNFLHRSLHFRWFRLFGNQESSF